MGDEMKTLFKKMHDTFIMLFINLFTTVIAVLARKMVATVFAVDGSMVMAHEEICSLVGAGNSNVQDALRQCSV
jgi:hypothetical protein